MLQRSSFSGPETPGSIRSSSLGLRPGARRSELLALQWADLDFETGIMNVSKSLEQTKAGLRIKSTKSSKPRRFAVPAAALGAPREHRARQDNDRAMFAADYEENDLVFCRPEGRYYSPDRICARVVELMKKAGLDGVTLHSLRHTNVSEPGQQGSPNNDGRETLGTGECEHHAFDLRSCS